MKISNLARRLEEFAAPSKRMARAKRPASHTWLRMSTRQRRRRAPRRLTLDTRRIQIRDSGLRQFRVF